MGAEGFWDDSERAAAVSAEHARTSRRLEAFRQLEADVDDLDGLAEMAAEDASVQEEVDEQIASVESRLAALEEQRLFSGPYDAGDALVTVNAGAGATDAQDWAEMVLRMEMRWAESRGFGVELLEVGEGEEAGIKSATFRASGENAYGPFGAARGVGGGGGGGPGAGAPPRFRPRPPPQAGLGGVGGGAGGADPGGGGDQ